MRRTASRLACVYLITLFSYIQADQQEIPAMTPELSPQSVAIRHHNIQLMRNALKSGEYEGYDILVISSTSKEEADYQQEKLEKTFAGTVNKNGRAPIILSVVDSIEAGQLIGSVYTWLRAEELFRKKHPELLNGASSFLDFIQSNRLKVASFHNGGKGRAVQPPDAKLGKFKGLSKPCGIGKKWTRH